MTAPAEEAPTPPDEWRRRQEEQALAYHFLGRCFYEPPRAEWLAACAGDRLFEAWPFPSGDDRTAAGLALLAEFCQGWNPEQLGALTWDFNRLFVGPGEMLAAPWESVYRSKTKLTFQEPTLQVRATYERFGVQAPAMHREPDDHLGLELAFMATLSDLAVPGPRPRVMSPNSHGASRPRGTSCRITCSPGRPPAWPSSRSTPRPTTTAARRFSPWDRSRNRPVCARRRRPGDAVPKIELYNAMREKRITKAELGRRLGWHMPQVDRALDVHHASRMDRLQQALQAVDRRLEVTVVEA